MKLLIFGSTGGTGLELIRQGLARGYQVLAFARKPEDVTIQHPSLKVLQGDVENPNDVRAAVKALVREGTDNAAVISVLGVRIGKDPSQARSKGTRHIVDALKAAGVRRFVSGSTLGAGDHLKTMPWLVRWLLPRLVGAWRLEEAGLQETIVRASGLDWVVLRPPRLVDGAASGKFKVGPDLAPSFGAKLTRGDLATALLDQVSSDRFLQQFPTVCPVPA